MCGKTEGSEGLVAHYLFNGNANDESGNGNNGVVFGATLTEDRFGNADSAYSFDGVSDYINIPRSSSIEPVGAVTVMAWVKPNDVGTWHQIITKRYNEFNDPWNSYILDTTNEGTSNKWRFSISNGIAGSKSNTFDTEVLKSNSWSYVVGTYDGSYIKLYINGILKSEKQKTGNIGYSSLSAKVGTTVPKLQGQHFNGIIDDVRIYNRALSETEIQVLYNEGN